MVTLWQCLVETLHHVFHGGDGAYLQETAENQHIEHLRVTRAGSLFHGIDTIDVDVIALRWLNDRMSIVDDSATGLHLWLELLQRRLIEHDGCIVGTDDWGADHFVTYDDSYVGSTTALFWTVCRHPTHFFAFHDASVGKNLAHREDALSSKT